MFKKLGLVAAFCCCGTLCAQTEWPTYGGDAGAMRYSSLAQITPSNAAKLVQAWVFDGDSESGGKTSGRSGEFTPLVIDGVLYAINPDHTVVALDPQTGKPIWIYRSSHTGRTPRGIAYWHGDKQDQNPARILFGTTDGFVIAVDAKTGKAIPGFGRNGEIDLKSAFEGSGNFQHYGVTAAPVVYKNLVITGSSTQDSPSFGPPGDATAWDARTGVLVWRFHSVPRPGETGHQTWPEDGWKGRSGVNAWNTGTVDEKTGTLYMTFDSPASDLYGGDRPGNNLFGNTLVALDALTGKLIWYFQTTHHDIWDFDEPGQPTLGACRDEKADAGLLRLEMSLGAAGDASCPLAVLTQRLATVVHSGFAGR